MYLAASQKALFVTARRHGCTLLPEACRTSVSGKLKTFLFLHKNQGFTQCSPPLGFCPHDHMPGEQVDLILFPRWGHWATGPWLAHCGQDPMEGPSWSPGLPASWPKYSFPLVCSLFLHHYEQPQSTCGVFLNLGRILCRNIWNVSNAEQGCTCGHHNHSHPCSSSPVLHCASSRFSEGHLSAFYNEWPILSRNSKWQPWMKVQQVALKCQGAAAVLQQIESPQLCSPTIPHFLGSKQQALLAVTFGCEQCWPLKCYSPLRPNS